MSEVTDNVLYVTRDDVKLAKKGESIVISGEEGKLLQVPLHHLAAVVIFGRAFVTPQAMAAIAARGARLSFVSAEGRFLASVEGPPHGNVLLRRAQHRRADDAAFGVEVARAIVLGKAVNARSHLRRSGREAKNIEDQAAFRRGADDLQRRVNAIGRAQSVDRLRGLEGSAARCYFGLFPRMLKVEEEALTFAKRSRRPPKDPPNALLSFGYALLMQDCAAALCAIGLDPAVGFFHRERPGRLSLALDLMEELRLPVVDRLVIALLNRKQLTAKSFVTDDAGGVRLKDDARKAFLVAYQQSKRGTIHHPFLDVDVTWSKIPYLQARLLARRLRGDLDAYPPFTLR